MQECTNSHAFGIAQAIGTKGPGYLREEWPTNAEEYAVLAMQLQIDKKLRQDFLPPMTQDLTNSKSIWSNPSGHKYKGLRMIIELAVRLTA
jgi:hypothetical protein